MLKTFENQKNQKIIKIAWRKVKEEKILGGKNWEKLRAQTPFYATKWQNLSTGLYDEELCVFIKFVAKPKLNHV